MKPGNLLLSGLIVSLLATAARATVFPYAEYHLGEAGSLSGTLKYPQDSSGAGRHFTSNANNTSVPVSSSVSPAATGSTACLQPQDDQCWGAGGIFYNLPTNDFAFGVFAQAPALPPPGHRMVFALGDSAGAFGLGLTQNGWTALVYQGTGADGLPGNFTPNTWVHLAVIRTNNESRFYINGVDQGTAFTRQPVHSYPQLARSWNSFSNPPFQGLIDEARVVTFPAGEPTAKILAELQTGAPPGSFVKVGSNASFLKANLSPAETSVFRVGGAVQDFVRVTDPDGLQVTGTAPEKHIIQIVKEGKLVNGHYPLIGFTGSIGGQGLAGLVPTDIPGRITESLEINAANSTIDLVIGGADGVTWTGAGSSVWNKEDTNWLLAGSNTATQFLDGDDVKFDDSPAGTVNAITVANGISPASMLVDASENYSFSGGDLALNGPLTKKGSGTLTLTNTVTGSGAIALQGGTLIIGDGATGGSISGRLITLSGGASLIVNLGGEVALPNSITGSGSIGKLGSGRMLLGGTAISGPVTLSSGQIGANNYSLFPGGVTVAAGASLDFRGYHPGAGSLTLNGGGTNGEGALLNSGNLVTLKGTHQLGGDASIGGGISLKDQPAPTYDNPYPSAIACYLNGNYKLTKVGPGALSFFKTTVTVKDIVINEGSLVAEQANTINNTYPGTVTVNSGASLDFGGAVNYTPTTTTSNCAKPIVLNGGTVSTSGGPFLSVSLPGGIQLNGACTLIAERTAIYSGPSGPVPTANLTVNGVVSGSGSLTVGGYGIVSLQAPAYTGDTTILAQPGNYYLRGRLSLGAPGLADTSTVSIADGAFLNLGFSGTDTVRRLFINGVQQQPGVYGSSHVSGRIMGNGTLTVTEGPAAPPYQLWATANGIAGADPNADTDGDGISNGIEFVIGGNPNGPDAALLPVMTQDGSNLKFIYRRTDASSANYPLKVEISTNLAAGSWTPAPENSTDPVLVESDGFGPGVDKVTVTIRTQGNQKFFARLKVDGL
ncbi:LamG-like jellyroll fold domain-containing protein [Haloferula sp. BvORR071]|uniref:LamG domain-containing protein n=1 Tax=Haloferula sp. BvORR071 TaxID=1396141 RepID=UPI0005553A5A|nr:LamG-like jellyroll fold domain-containing protein [Haloferula sp. BvORR071]